MTKQEYDVLSQKHTAEELADAFVFPVTMSKKQKKETDIVLKEALKQRRAIISPEDQLKGTLLQLRFQIEDYLNDIHYDKRKTFGYFLKSYIDGLKIRRNEFAHEINIKPTELSQYINDHRKPPQNIIIRLELHSNNMIPATDWYRLLEKETIHDLRTNKILRRDEKKFVIKHVQLN